MSIVKYALNEHAHSWHILLESGYLTTLYSCDDCQRGIIILPSSFSVYIHRRTASTNQTVSAYLSLRQAVVGHEPIVC